MRRRRKIGGRILRRPKRDYPAATVADFCTAALTGSVEQPHGTPPPNSYEISHPHRQTAAPTRGARNRARRVMQPPQRAPIRQGKQSATTCQVATWHDLRAGRRCTPRRQSGREKPREPWPAQAPKCTYGYSWRYLLSQRRGARYSSCSSAPPILAASWRFSCSRTALPSSAGSASRRSGAGWLSIIASRLSTI